MKSALLLKRQDANPNFIFVAYALENSPKPIQQTLHKKSHQVVHFDLTTYTQIREDSRILVRCHFLAPKPGDPMDAYVSFEYETLKKLHKITHEPGIPKASLIPEKVLPIAQWIVRQIRRDRPEWLIEPA